jgi:hypothetical protein
MHNLKQETLSPRKQAREHLPAPERPAAVKGVPPGRCRKQLSPRRGSRDAGSEGLDQPFNTGSLVPVGG